MANQENSDGFNASAIEALKAKIDSEKGKLRLTLVEMLAEAMRRRLAMQDDVRRQIGLADLAEHPTEEKFYAVLNGIEGFLSDVRFNDLFSELGFDGETGDKWYQREKNAAPARFGRSILEMLFVSAFDRFCDWEVLDELRSLFEGDEKLLNEATALASGKVNVAVSPLTTKLEDIGWGGMSSRLVNVLMNDKVVYLGDILLQSRSQWRRAPNCGEVSIQELQSFLGSHGRSLQLSVHDVLMTPELAEFKEWKSSQE